jgi:alpha-L-fucosidase
MTVFSSQLDTFERKKFRLRRQSGAVFECAASLHRATIWWKRGGGGFKIREMKRRNLLTLAVAVCQIGLAVATASADDAKSPVTETPAQHDARMAWWREARFGMFIHWGLYSQAAGVWDGKPTSGAGEWMMNDKQIPLSQYARLVSQFNPVKFDADAWVRAAKGAGMKYIVITSKHHEGFGMFPSSLTDWCVKSTPFGRDPLKELAAACQKEGLKLCFYHSIMDWHSPLYAPRKPWNDIATDPPDFDAYDAYLKGQLKELLSGDYGPIGVVWFDGQWEDTWTYGRGVDLFNYVRSLAPNIIINDRVGTNHKLLPGQIHVGDYKTPEQTIPPNGFGKGVDWETCMTMNDTWGYKTNDDTWKSTETLVRNLIDCASKGGNYLLNVGPTGEGLIPDPSIERLKEVGRWMDANGTAIYGTTASPFSRRLPWGRCTTKISGSTTTLYLHVFDWPGDGRLLVPGLKNKIKTACLLTDPGKAKLATKNRKDGVLISLPMAAPDRISSTIVLELGERPEVQLMPLTQDLRGSILLPAIEARMHGDTIKYESGAGLDNIGYWVNSSDWADWEFVVTKRGKFTVTADIAAPAPTSFELSVAGQTLRNPAPVTANYTTFQTVTLGTVEIPAPDKITLAVRAIKDGWQPMNLKAVRLEPVTSER